MKVTNLSQVQHLIALAVSVSGKPLLVVETLKGEDQKTVMVRSGAALFEVTVDEVPGQTSDSLGLGDHITLAADGTITVIGQADPSEWAVATNETPTQAAGKQAVKARPKSTGRTPDTRIRNE